MDHLEPEQLAKMLDTISDRNRRAAQWNYDTVACARLLAKAELAEELAALLRGTDPGYPC